MKKLFTFTVLIVLTFILAGCSSEPTSDEKLVETYKHLVLKDFESQKVVEDEELSNKLLQEIFVEPALSEYGESLQLMRANNIKRVYNNPNFINVTVIQNDGNLALVNVKAEYTGDDFSITVPAKNLGPFAFNYCAEVTLKKVKRTWYISKIKMDTPK